MRTFEQADSYEGQFADYISLLVPHRLNRQYEFYARLHVAK